MAAIHILHVFLHQGISWASEVCRWNKPFPFFFFSPGDESATCESKEVGISVQGDVPRDKASKAALMQKWEVWARYATQHFSYRK